MKSMKKRIIALALSAALLLPLIPMASAYENVSDWAVREVTAMDELGLIPDTLEYADMTEEITRMDMCHIAVAAYEQSTGTVLEAPEEAPFLDTSEEDAGKAYALGLIQGDGNGLFRPNDPLTRLEFFTFVGRFLVLTEIEITPDAYSDLSQFTDTEGIPDWAMDHTRLTVGLEIVKGTGTTLNWRSTTSCQEALAMFYRAYNVSIGYDPAAQFIDLSPWAQESVLRMDQLGLIPDSVKESSMAGTITRAELCKIAMNSYKRLTGTTDEQLGVPENDPFSDTDDVDILNAYRLGIINGKDNGTFCPDDPITRQDFFKISANFLEAVDYWYVEDVIADLSVYHDANEIASYAYIPTQLLVGIGVVQGDDLGCLNPTDNIIAQEALVIFLRIYNFYVDWYENPVEPEPYLGQLVVETAMEYLGYPYVYGGKSPSGFDCSGFVYYVYKQYGYTLNPGARNQWKAIDNYVEKDQLLPGDLVFFSKTGAFDDIYHVGLYIGNNQFIHASNSRVGVIISSLDDANYPERYYGAQRPIGSENLANGLVLAPTLD